MFWRMSENGLLKGIEELNLDMPEMPVDVIEFESRVKNMSSRILTIWGIWTLSSLAFLENSFMSLVPAFATYFIYRQKQEQAYWSFHDRFKEELEIFVSQAQIYAVPFIERSIMQILQIADKEDFSDVEVSQAINDIKEFFL